ncbi:MAG TPA: class I SAM-dependent methyltransferase [Thermoanaerobaculia bacterium]|nr:class I SAM-dependent methyltransferase [Thermoanaerobaculia bacterium]
MSLPYAEFFYPLNVFMHILTHEEGDVPYLHYALFAHDGESMAAAQEHSTELLLARLPPPPARILEVGIGLATTLARLTSMGYQAEGITPDEKQIAMARAKHGDAVRVHCAAFENFDSDRTYDVVMFQESSQYIDAEALFAKAEQLTKRVLVLDEFSLRPLDPPALHARSAFVDAAARHGFEVHEELDLSRRAAPTIQYFLDRLPSYRERLIADLALTNAQVDDLIVSGENYLARYNDGTYGYRLFDFTAAARTRTRDT